MTQLFRLNLTGRLAVLVVGVLLGAAAVAHAQPPRNFRPTHRKYVYGARAYVAELSDLMVQQANAACVEMHAHYQQNRGFKRTYAQMYKLLEQSQHIAGLVKQNYYRGSPRKDDHIARDLWEMDQLFDYVEYEIRTWQSDYRNPQRDGTLRVVMNDFEQTLDYLMEDYGVKSRIQRKRRPIVVGPQTTVIVPSNVPPSRVIVTPPRVVAPRVNVVAPRVNIVVPRR